MLHIVVRDNCQWCDMAKALLDEKGLPYKTYNIGAPETPFRSFIRETARTAPQIWECDLFGYIGGYDDLKAYLDTLD